jgi:hypothetical protein
MQCEPALRASDDAGRRRVLFFERMGWGQSARHFLAVTLAAGALAVTRPAHSEPTRTPKAPAAKENPRTWLLVVGGAFFALGYGIAVGTALSGGDTLGPDGKWNFGNPKLLYLPYAGPFLYDRSQCSDGNDYFEAHPLESRPDRRDYCSNFHSGIEGVPQVLGGLLIGLAFAIPQRSSSARSSVPIMAFSTRPGGGQLGVMGSF